MSPQFRSLSSSAANYRPISITSVLYKVFERLASVRPLLFIECSGVLPTTQFAYRKGLGTCDSLLSLSHTLQSALERGQEARVVQIDFSAAFDRVNPLGILNMLCSVGIGGSLMAVVPSPGFRVAVAQSLIRDLGRVSELCDLWGMKLNASKTKTMIVSRSRTMHPQLPPLTPLASQFFCRVLPRAGVKTPHQ